MSTSPPSSPPHDLIPDVIRQITPARLAKHFNLTPHAIASWAANRKIPWKYLAQVADLLPDADLNDLMNANGDAPTQKFRGAARHISLLEDLAKLENGGGGASENDPEVIGTLSTKHNIEPRLLKVILKTATVPFSTELAALTSLNRQFSNKEEQRAALNIAAKTLNVGVHEVNRRLRRWGISPPPLKSVEERIARQGRRQKNQERLAIAVRSYLRGSHSADAAAILGQTSTHYLYRIARTTLDSFGESLRTLRSLPNYMRHALAEDVYAALHGETTYAAPLFALYRTYGAARKTTYTYSLSDAYADLVPAAVRRDVTIEEIAAFKEAPAQLVTQRLTEHLVHIGLTWQAVENFTPAHREAFYELLLRKKTHDTQRAVP